MAVQTNNLKRLIILFWRHSQRDWENSWTTELYKKLIYDDKLRLRHQNQTDFIWANVNRRTESYQQHKDVVRYFRRHKERYHPLVIMELRFPNDRFSKEEKYIIQRQYDIKQVMQRIHYWMLEYQR